MEKTNSSVNSINNDTEPEREDNAIRSLGLLENLYSLIAEDSDSSDDVSTRIRAIVPPIYIWQLYSVSGQSQFIPPEYEIEHVDEIMLFNRTFDYLSEIVICGHRELNEAAPSRNLVNEGVTTRSHLNQGPLERREAGEAETNRRDVNAVASARLQRRRRNRGTSARCDVYEAVATRRHESQNVSAHQERTLAQLTHHHFTYYRPDRVQPVNNTATQFVRLPGLNGPRRLYYSYSLSATLVETDDGWFSSRDTFCVNVEEVDILEHEANGFHNGVSTNLERVTSSQQASPMFQFLLNIVDRSDGFNEEEEISRGMIEAEINDIPSSKYSGHVEGTSVCERCNVCLADYQEGDYLRHLSCGHTFHKHCVDQWLKTDVKCPMCRRNQKKRYFL